MEASQHELRAEMRLAARVDEIWSLCKPQITPLRFCQLELLQIRCIGQG